MPKRVDGTFIRQSEPLHAIFPYLMPKRTESEICLTEKFDATELLRYIEKHNEENKDRLKFFHCFCYALAKTIYHRPKMNIFIKGKRYWQRKDITLSFVAKQSFNDHSEEKLLFLKVKDEMTINEISHIILGDVQKTREAGSNDIDKLLGTLAKLPRFLLNFIFWFVQVLDYFGIMPSSLMQGDSNYSTVLISNLGSIKAPAPYHHLNNYGTNSIMVTIGTIEEINDKKMVDITFIIDERIADGFYFAKSLRYIKYIFAHPEMLNETIKTPYPEVLD